MRFLTRPLPLLLLLVVVLVLVVVMVLSGPEALWRRPTSALLPEPLVAPATNPSVLPGLLLVLLVLLVLVLLLLGGRVRVLGVWHESHRHRI